MRLTCSSSRNSEAAFADHAVAFAVHGLRRIDHHFRDGVVFDQRLDRAEAEHLVGDELD